MKYETQHVVNCINIQEEFGYLNIICRQNLSNC